MKITKLIGTAILLPLFGLTLPAHAQEPRDQQEAPREEPKDRPKEQPKEEPKKQPEPAKEHPKDQARPNEQAAPSKDEHSKPEQAQRGRIPDDKFKAHFGREHTFHVGHPEIVGGHPHFAYGGYSFVIAQPWPSGWGYDDDVYVVDINGVYYLVDVTHPGAQLALTVVL
jgi:hypothetical protein